MPVIKGGRPERAVAPDEHGRRGAKAPAGQAPVMRRASLVMIVLLVIQSGVGIVVNLDATIPATDPGAGIGAAVGGIEVTELSELVGFADSGGTVLLSWHLSWPTSAVAGYGRPASNPSPQ
jgi:hypothetical protein